VFVFTRFARAGGSLAHHRVKSITPFLSHNFTRRQFLIQQGVLARYQQSPLVTGASRWLDAVGWVMLSEKLPANALEQAPAGDARQRGYRSGRILFRLADV
jgi:hypothetical protein